MLFQLEQWFFYEKLYGDENKANRILKAMTKRKDYNPDLLRYKYVDLKTIKDMREYREVYSARR